MIRLLDLALGLAVSVPPGSWARGEIRALRYALAPPPARSEEWLRGRAG